MKADATEAKKEAARVAAVNQNQKDEVMLNRLRMSTTSKSPRKIRKPSKPLSSKSMLTDPVISTKPSTKS